MILDANEKYRLLLEKNKVPAARTDEEEKSLRFNMVTVLFADIHGFSKLMEGWTPPS